MKRNNWYDDMGKVRSLNGTEKRCGHAHPLNQVNTATVQFKKRHQI